MKKLLSIFLSSSLVLLILGFTSCEKEDLGTGSVYGIVTDKATGEPIKNAGVLVNETGSKAVTGVDGYYNVPELNSGTYTLSITKTGYTDFITNAITVKPDQPTQCDVQLELLPPALKVLNDNRQEISVLNYGTSQKDVMRSFNLFNDGVENLEWKIVKSCEWISSISQTEGVLKPGATQAVVITIDRSYLEGNAQDKTTIHIVSNNGSKQLIIKAYDAVLATSNMVSISNVTVNSALLKAVIINDGEPKYEERGFIIGTNSGSSIDNCFRKLSCAITDKKEFDILASNLTENQLYYVRAYTITDSEINYSSNEISFRPQKTAPIVLTKNVNYETNNSITLNGSISFAGDPAYTERGFVIGKMKNPTIENDDKHIVKSGSGSSDYSINVSGYATGDTYYVRAYAINEVGISYGDNVEMVIFTRFVYKGQTYMVAPDLEHKYDWYSAQVACEDLQYGGYIDWYLPSKEELNYMYILKSEIGGFYSFMNSWYWSSTEYNSDRVWEQDFYDGQQSHPSKSSSNRVRCVRRD